MNSFAIYQRKQELIRMVLEGHHLKDCAKALGTSFSTIRNYINDPQVRNEITELQKDLVAKLDTQLVITLRTKTEAIDEIAWTAIERMQELLEDRSTHVSVVAKLIDSALDRCPEVSRTKKLDITSKTLTLKGEDLQDALQAMQEIQQREQERTKE